MMMMMMMSVIFSQVSVAPSGLVWALTWLGSALVRLGVSLTDPSGTHWAEVAAPSPDTPLSVLGVGGAGVWAVARGGGVWLRQGVRSDCTGSGQEKYYQGDFYLVVSEQELES